MNYLGHGSPTLSPRSLIPRVFFLFEGFGGQVAVRPDPRRASLLAAGAAVRDLPGPPAKKHSLLPALGSGRRH